jgi:hypothetical protein
MHNYFAQPAVLDRTLKTACVPTHAALAQGSTHALLIALDTGEALHIGCWWLIPSPKICTIILLNLQF